tara:strand:- start:801 stop:1292 length:492 start_codon:yes stop_codon:yes gene_type:complete
MALSTTRTLLTQTGINTHQVFNMGGINAVGVVTATSFSGSFDASNLTGTVADARISSLTASKLSGALPAIDGSNLTSLPAGLGTALSQTQTDPLNKIYFTDNILEISSTTRINPPPSATVAYTNYSDIKITGSADLIISDGDEFIPDVLGLSTTSMRGRLTYN